MAKTIRNWALMLAALLLVLACATPVVTPPPTGFAETAIAGTYSVAASQTAQVKVSLADSKTLTPTTTRVASATPLATFTMVLLGSSELTVLVDAPCRVGPGSIYDRVLLLRRGQTADLVGRSADGAYWIIRNPNRTQQLCWVESSAVRINRVTGNLPVMTPPPPPTPTRTPTRTARPPNTATLTPSLTLTVGPTSTDTPTEIATATPIVLFNLLYRGQDECISTPGIWWLNLEVGNTGEVDFESLSLVLTDNTTATDYSLDADVFTDRNGCGPAITENVLQLGIGLIVSAPELNFDPTGRSFTATIMLCDEDGQVGLCDTQTINFTP